MKRVKFNRFWFLKSLPKNSGATADLIPEIRMPSGEDEWDVEGKKVRWVDGWRNCWHAILTQFSPHTMRAVSPERMRSYQPASGREWLSEIDDELITKSQAQLFHDLGVNHYSLLTDIFGWALDSTLKYFRRGKRKNVADTYFYDWPKSQRRCQVLVNWVVRFAEARRRFHLHVSHAGNIRGQNKGRPPRLKMGRTGDEDLWLILIWPIARRKNWTYQDVVRALRLHFLMDRFGEPPQETPRQKLQILKAFFHGRQSRIERKWRQQALKVTGPEKKKMRLRCQRLGLDRLLERSRKHPDIERVPPWFELADSFDATHAGFLL